MSQIKLKHSGGNSVIIAAPDSNPASDRTLKLPSDVDSTIDTLKRQYNVLQVFSTAKTDTASASVNMTSDWVSHGLSVSITPSSSSNKIFITGQVSVCSDLNDGISLGLFKNGSSLSGATGDAEGSRKRQTAGAEMDYNFALTTIPFQFLDTAGGTSAITYAPAINISNSNSYTIYMNRTVNNVDVAAHIKTISVITAWEIAS